MSKFDPHLKLLPLKYKTADFLRPKNAHIIMGEETCMKRMLTLLTKSKLMRSNLVSLTKLNRNNNNQNVKFCFLLDNIFHLSRLSKNT